MSEIELIDLDNDEVTQDRLQDLVRTYCRTESRKRVNGPGKEMIGKLAIFIDAEKIEYKFDDVDKERFKGRLNEGVEHPEDDTAERHTISARSFGFDEEFQDEVKDEIIDAIVDRLERLIEEKEFTKPISLWDKREEDFKEVGTKTYTVEKIVFTDEDELDYSNSLD